MKRKRLFLYLPILWLAGFFTFYLISAALWPGGHKWEHSLEGHNWVFNYYCDLLHHKAYNGVPNPGRPFIMASLLGLVLSFLSFWINMVNFWFFHKKHKLTCNIFGLSVVGCFIALPVIHDSALIAATILGWIGFTFLLILLYLHREFWVMAITVMLLITVSFNFFTWHTGIMIKSAPLLQKVAFCVYAVWVSLISFRIIRYRDALSQNGG